MPARAHLAVLISLDNDRLPSYLGGQLSQAFAPRFRRFDELSTQQFDHSANRYDWDVVTLLNNTKKQHNADVNGITHPIKEL